MTLASSRPTLFICLILAVIVGCAGVKPPVAQIQISASSELNPDGQGRPSPVVLQIYELRSVNAFNNARFDELYENSASTLGDDLVNQQEVVIAPGETRELATLTTEMDVRFLGFLAAYRDTDNAVWRTSYQLLPGEAVDINVQLDRLAITVSQ